MPVSGTLCKRKLITMNKNDLNPAKGVEWDLSNLYQSLDDKNIAKDKSDVLKNAQAFTKQYRGKIKTAELTPQELANAFEQYQEIFSKVYVLGSYSGLMQAKNTGSDKINRLFAQIQEFATEVQNELMFLELELLEVSEEEIKKYLKDKSLKDFHQFIIRTRKFKKHTLEESQEVIINKKSQTGSQAFVRLYDQLSADLKFPLTINGKKQELNYSEITNILSSHKDRAVREQAAKSITEVYKNNSKTFAFILNTLILDKKVTDEIRSYAYPQESTFISDEISKDVVDAMTSSIEKRYSISERYYKAKSNAQGLKLHEWDRYSNVYKNLEEPSFSYEEAKDLILDAFHDFSPTFADIANKFFHNNWIDAELGKSKKSGAFCSYIVPDKHPVILTNFTGKANDVRTLAHELGHGIHAYLSRKQNLFNYWPVTPFAEIASIFCETIVFNRIYKETSDKRQKANLLGGRIQEIFATIFRQNAFYLYESDIHRLRREEGELSVDELNTNFQSRLQEIFGKGLELTDGHKYWWAPIAHFYHYNFYVFSYAFGQSLTNALYGAYVKEGDTFTKNYTEVLKLGSSRDLTSLTKSLNVDISEKSFWDDGLDIIDGYVEEFSGLVS